MPLLEARNLHLRFGDRVVLEDVSLAFEEGCLSGIMGPNGAGKTTCFNVLTGRYKPDRGQVLLEGVDITGRSPQAIALPGLRARARDPFGQAYADPALVAEAQTVLGMVGLAERANDLAKALPYGARRALEIAVALAAKPKLLFLDEPTAGLGSDGRAQLAKLVANLKGAATIVIIEHDMQFLFSLAEQISVIHWGQVIARGTPEDLRANPWVKASNLGRLQ